ncbi:MAG: helix-turn-helix domain-containing protein, partial [Clostridia bacterium]|nr:helix-turn-helix domain-containing protein [Clostridia bacterium]
MLIGDKIRSLRKNKNITQTQLAEALSVSSQSVSKWENHVSVPDISVLPVIARYFGITMDDLFSYRLDALNYKERFIRFMMDNGMLRFGEYPLKSGRVS